MKPSPLICLSAEARFSRSPDALGGYDNIVLSGLQESLDALINYGASMVFIDGGFHAWRSFVLACKTNAATRRIPLCLVSDDQAQRADAINCGAELALAWAEWQAGIQQIIADWARKPDPATLARLKCECQSPPPALAMRGIDAFNRGEYYRQHDLFEALWVETDGPVRDLYRAVLQVGVAYYQIERGNFRGALKMLQRSAQWLRLLPDRCQDIDVQQLRRDSFAVRAELQRLGPERLDEFDRRLLRNLPYAPGSPKT